MSEKRLSLSNPLVVGVVLVLLAGVLFVNIRTFGPKARPKTRQAVQIKDYPSLPVDLEQILQRSAVAGQAVGGFAVGSELPAMGRDPFVGKKKSSSPVAAPVDSKMVADADPDSLVCAAVMLGGRRPVALINGEALAVGDRIREYRVMSIETTGVGLQAGNGKDRFLGVGRSDKSNKSYRMVRDVPDPENQGRTSLDDSANEERRRP